MTNMATLEIKAAVPARDFELSKRFYADLGFELAWSSDDLAYFHASGPVTQVNGLFLPRSQASGQAAFFDYPGCGTATAVEWTATRR